ncbi:MAG: hypothetical protein IJL90_08155 [Lachnospiraceae bacterium]|nr:hypothetical protein [Lachnospiraceae bacterium]MBR4574997.1 hypothetical protein [Lachnospiraceae bacterium]
MNTKRIPALVMLLAGAVVAIVTYINHYSLEESLKILILTLIVFLIVGVIIKLIFDSFHIEEPDEDRVDDEGEVVEKSEFGDEPLEGEEDGASEAEEGENEEGSDAQQQ